MQQLREQEKSLNLTSKSELIQCPQHKKPIKFINISQQVKIGERLCCDKCSTLGQQVISIRQAESSLIELLKQEDETIKLEKDQLIQWVNRGKAIMKQIQKQFIHTIEHLKSKLTKIASLLKDETIGASSLQELAVFLSKQTIVNGKFQLKNTQLPVQIKHKLEQSLNQFTSQLDSLRSALKQFEANMQFEFRNFEYKDLIKLDAHSKNITALAISNDENLMASGGDDLKIILWDFDEKTIKQQFCGSNPIQNLVFCSDNRLLAAASNQDILIFDLTSLKTFNPQITLQGHSLTVRSIVFTKNSKFLISGGQDKILRIWNLDEQKCIKNQKLPNRIYGVSISQDDKLIAACGGNGQVVLYDSSKIETLVEKVKWKAHGFVNCTAFTEDSKYILTCQIIIKLWSIVKLQANKKTPLKVFKGHDMIANINLRMNSQILISLDSQIKIRNMNNGELINTFQIADGCINFFNKNLIITQDMQYIIVGGQNGKLQILELYQI